LYQYRQAIAGALFDMKGEAIGIVTSKLSAARMFNLTKDITEKVNYAVKISYLNGLLMTLPREHRIPVHPAKQGALSGLAKQLKDSVMIVVAR